MSNLLASSKIEDRIPGTTPENEVEESPGFYRGVIIDSLTVLTALFTGYIFNLFISNQPMIIVGVPPTWATLLVFLSLFLIASLLESILIKNTLRHLLVLLLQVASLSVFLYQESSIWLFTFLITLVIFFWAAQTARMEMENALRIRFFKIAQHFLGKAILGVALMGVVFYFPAWQAQPQLIPDETLNSVIDWTTKLTSSWYGGLSFDSNSAIENVINDISKNQLESNPLWIQLPLIERDSQLSAVKTDLSTRLQGLLGLESLNPEEKIRDVIRHSLENNVRDLESRFQQWFFWGWITIMLVLVLGFGRIYGILLSFLALMIYETLIVTKFLRVYSEARAKEILDF